MVCYICIKPLRFIHVVACINIYPFLWLNNSTLFRYTTFYLPTYQLIDAQVGSTFGLLWIMLIWTFVCKLLCAHVLSFFLGIYMEVEFLGHTVGLFKKFLKQQLILHCYKPSMRVPFFPIFSSTLVSTCLFYYSHYNGVKWL